MLIKIGSKEYGEEKMELVDSISGFNWQEFMYYNKNLLKTTDGEYILETNLFTFSILLSRRLAVIISFPPKLICLYFTIYYKKCQ